MDSLLALLTHAVEPFRLNVRESKVPESNLTGDISPTADPAVTIRVVSLDRVGRSRRGGSILDLNLTAAVFTTGPHFLDATEQMLRTIEVDARFSAAPLSWTPAPSAGLGFLVSARVCVRLDERVGPEVSRPLRVDIRISPAAGG